MAKKETITNKKIAKFLNKAIKDGKLDLSNFLDDLDTNIFKTISSGKLPKTTDDLDIGTLTVYQELVKFGIPELVSDDRTGDEFDIIQYVIKFGDLYVAYNATYDSYNGIDFDDEFYPVKSEKTEVVEYVSGGTPIAKKIAKELNKTDAGDAIQAIFDEDFEAEAISDIIKKYGEPEEISSTRIGDEFDMQEVVYEFPGKHLIAYSGSYSSEDGMSFDGEFYAVNEKKSDKNIFEEHISEAVITGFKQFKRNN